MLCCIGVCTATLRIYKHTVQLTTKLVCQCCDTLIVCAYTCVRMCIMYAVHTEAAVCAHLIHVCYVYTNSGGQKRKLSLAISFTGQPQFVLCDEPSSGKCFHIHMSHVYIVWELVNSVLCCQLLYMLCRVINSWCCSPRTQSGVVITLEHSNILLSFAYNVLHQ
jgi:hypothetical protein